MSNKGILVVSFGSSHKDTRKKIDIIENEIQETFKEFKIYKAYTSKIILKILIQRDHIHIFSVVEVLEEMHKDGIEDIIIQPTLILNGIEYDIMSEEISGFREKFKSIKYGAPLLTSTEDSFKVIDAFLRKAPNLLRKKLLYLWDMAAIIFQIQFMQHLIICLSQKSIRMFSFPRWKHTLTWLIYLIVLKHETIIK